MGKKSWVILILASAITCSVARAEVGLSYLGLCNKTWPCGQSLNAFAGLPVIRTGWIEHTFGSECPCAKRLLNDPRPKEIRVHLSNGPCLRNRRCGPYEVFAGETVASANRKVVREDKRLLDKFKRVALRFKKRLDESRGGVTCYVSPCLECDLNEPARAVLHRITSDILPSCSLVDSPHGSRCIKGKTCEGHGPSPKLSAPCIADLDGKSAEEVSVSSFLERTKHCDLSFVWSVGMNCNSHHGPMIDPRRRDCQKPKGYFMDYSRWLHREFK